MVPLMISAPELSLNYLPRLPRRREWRIGCAGAGFIMRDCHLVAYRQAGFHPVARELYDNISRIHRHCRLQRTS